ncbi:hypothetical protein Avbf_14317 [Armadillidium vulgare]|nr:hypothetical protein Avbf_14317 [Armadillidium vulgare]
MQSKVWLKHNVETMGGSRLKMEIHFFIPAANVNICSIS